MIQPLPQVNFVQSVKRAFNNYFNFQGRIRRSEYWWFWFFLTICNIIIIILALVFGHESEEYDYGEDEYTTTYEANSGIMIVFLIFNIFVFIPHLSAIVRRLHDTGKSGVFVLVIFIPFIGYILLIILLCQDSIIEDNEYGPSPKYNANNTNQQINYQIYPNSLQTDNVQINTQYNPPQYIYNINQIPNQVPYQVPYQVPNQVPNQFPNQVPNQVPNETAQPYAQPYVTPTYISNSQ